MSQNEPGFENDPILIMFSYTPIRAKFTLIP